MVRQWRKARRATSSVAPRHGAGSSRACVIMPAARATLVGRGLVAIPRVLPVHQATVDLVSRYDAAFNAGDMPACLGMLTEDIVHDLDPGGREAGKRAFAAFMQRMNRRYREAIVDRVIMANAAGRRGAGAGRDERRDAGLCRSRLRCHRARTQIGAGVEPSRWGGPVWAARRLKPHGPGVAAHRASPARHRRRAESKNHRDEVEEEIPC